MARIRGIGTAQHARRRAIRPWNPRILGADLDGWWNPNSGIPVDADVDLWGNQGAVGASLNVSQAISGQRPFGNSTGGPNGRGSVDFTAANSDVLTSTSGYIISQPHTVLAQVDWGAGNTTFFDAGALNRYRIYKSGGFVKIYAGAGLTSVYAPGASWFFLAVEFNGVNSRIDIFEGPSIVGDGGIFNSTNVTIGARGGGGTYFNGSLGHILHVKRALTATERSLALPWLSLQ